LQLSLFSDPALPLIRDRLIARHGRIDDARTVKPTDQLILAILSADTSDKAALVAFEKLRLRFPCWEELFAAEPAAVATTIADIRHATVKAEHLTRALHEITAQYGTLDLGFLADWTVTDAWTWLQTLPGVGPKVAAATLNFSSLRKPILTVDKYLLRVGKRLGLLPPKADFQRGHRLLNGRVPNDWDDRDTYQQHWLMKFHSQTTCRSSKPLCQECPLKDMCQNFAAEPSATN
jgi:endonuclease-3